MKMITDDELACYKSNYEMLFQELDRLAYEMNYESSKILKMLFHVKCDMKRGKVVNECVETDEGWQELKPCPFCGGSQVEIYSPYKGVYKVICLCGACGASSPDEKKAYMYWNRRRTDD